MIIYPILNIRGEKMYRLLKGKISDTDLAMSIIDQARIHLKEQGIDQWQKGYPDAECIRNDFANERGYFLVDSNGEYMAYLCLDFDGEPVYKDLVGEWKYDGEYAAIHRVALNNDYRGRGLCHIAFELCEEECRKRGVHCLRVDTAHNNYKMKHIVTKAGYEFRGNIYYNRDERDAFEKILL